MSHFHKEISLLQAIALLLTTLLGTGAFVVPALSATAAGDQVLWAWLIMLAVMLPVGITFGLLGAIHPHAGGTAYLLGKAFGPRWQNATGWLYLALVPVGLPAAMAICVSYLGQLLGLGHQYDGWLALGCLAIMLLINLRGVRTASQIQLLIAISVAGCLALLIQQSELQLDTLEPPTPELSALPEISHAMAIIFWCFMGIEAMTHMGSELKNPRRDFPLTIVISLLITAGFYYLTVGLVLQYGSFGNEQTDSRSLALIAEQVLGPAGDKLISLMGFLASFASMSLYLMSFSRLLWSMADEGELPAPLARINSRGVPAVALLSIGVVAALSLLMKYVALLPLDALISYADGIFVMIYLLGVASGLRLLPSRYRPLALLATVLCGLILLAVGQYMSYALVIMLLSMGWDHYRSRQRTAIDA